jgi:hypothetical protein
LGIRLDWQVEAERVRVGEDPTARQQRRMVFLRIMMLMGAVVVVVGAVFGFVALRLQSVDDFLRRELVETVQAEVTALRIGDYGAFAALQRSASPNWKLVQDDRFQRYQALKTTTAITLSGQVVDATIDSPRGRVVLEEIIDGNPHHTVWFYWRFDDGWRHVPSDYTFWGAAQVIQGSYVTVQARALDGRLAEGLARHLDTTWPNLCRAVGCAAEPPTLTVDIIASPTLRMGWANDGRALTLLVPSPLAEERAPVDNVVPAALDGQIAALLSEKLLTMGAPEIAALESTNFSDAAWLRQTAHDWLTQSLRFTSADEPSARYNNFVAELNQNYGPAALASVLKALRPASDMRVVAAALGQPLDALLVDWRGYFQRRLEVEKELVSRGDVAQLQTLWDARSPEAIQALQARLRQTTQAAGVVRAVAISPQGDIPVATVQIERDGLTTIAVFHLIDGTWKRVA